MLFISGRNKGLNLRIFLQVQEASFGVPTSHRERHRSKLAHAHAAQLEVVGDWQIFQRCFPIAAIFHTWSLLMPSPPSIRGKVMSSQATFAPPWVNTGPFQRNLFKICSTRLIIFLGRMKSPFQKDCILHNTYYMSCNRPAKEKNLEVHVLILDVILSTRVYNLMHLALWWSKELPNTALEEIHVETEIGPIWH